MSNVHNGQGIMDSRDIIARIEELESDRETLVDAVTNAKEILTEASEGTITRSIEDVLKLFPNTTEQDWKQHAKGHGWVQNSAYADETATIEGLVFGNARVFGNTWVYGDAQVYDYAQVFGDAWVSGDARVYGDARVFGGAWKTSPLYAQGSKHCASNASYGSIAIGCEIHTFAVWLTNYEAIGRKNGYTEDQIKEYKAIIDLFVKVGR